MKIVLLFIAFAFFSCEKLKPETVNVPDYPNLEDVFNKQTSLLEDRKLVKEVWIDGKSETKTFDLDTVGWKKELSFLKEINPNTPEYVGAFEKSEKNGIAQLMLMEGEKGELKSVSYLLEDNNYTKLKATIHEEKEVYSHHRDFDLVFEYGLLKEYKISGYQKIVLKDTIVFDIQGVVIN
ncbi:MAG: hypothetical protein AB8B73_14715 [Ekhidna sp.]